MKSSPTLLAAAATLCALAAGMSCGGPGPVTPQSTPTPTPSVTPTPEPPGPVSICSQIGLGMLGVSCEENPDGVLSAAYQADLDAAIAQVQRDSPELFKFDDDTGNGGYLVLDPEAFQASVIERLAQRSVCAAKELRGEYVQLKKDNSLSENFDILTANFHIRTGPKVFIHRCSPAEFPLSPEDIVARIRVAFFGFFDCPDGTVKPPPYEGRLPTGCSGILTATPKDEQGLDVPVAIHGRQISWAIRLGDGTQIATRPVPEQPFNYVLTGRELGGFSICATVLDETGCLNGSVVPNP